MGLTFSNMIIDHIQRRNDIINDQKKNKGTIKIPDIYTSKQVKLKTTTHNSVT